MDTRVHQRCFAAQVATNQQDHVRIFDARNGGVEVYGRQRRRIICKPGLTALKHGRACKHARGKHCFAIDLIACDYRSIAGPIGLDCVKRLGPAGCNKLPILTDIRLVQTTMREAIHGMACLIRRPFFVYIIIDARKRPQHGPAPAIKADIGADCVHHVDGWCLFQLPWACFESIRLRRQRTDRTQVHDIA